MSNYFSQKDYFKGHKSNTETFKSGTRTLRKNDVPVARRITIPVDNEDQYKFAAERLGQLVGQMQKVLRQRTSFMSKKFHLDYLIHETTQDLKYHANKDNSQMTEHMKTYHYKGVK